MYCVELQHKDVFSYLELGLWMKIIPKYSMKSSKNRANNRQPDFFILQFQVRQLKVAVLSIILTPSYRDLTGSSFPSISNRLIRFTYQKFKRDGFIKLNTTHWKTRPSKTSLPSITID